MNDKEKFTLRQIKLKIQRYCIIEDRCQNDIIKKMNDWSVNKRDVEKLVNSLIKDDFLNEQRFADSFAMGKFKIKKWGKVKISYFLKIKGVANDCILSALSQINHKEYMLIMHDIFKKKKKSLKGEKNKFKKNAKAANYMIRKGFEPNLVWDVIKSE